MDNSCEFVAELVEEPIASRRAFGMKATANELGVAGGIVLSLLITTLILGAPGGRRAGRSGI
jgi:hypothetical protein